jgi:acyl-CoA thioesterase I
MACHADTILRVSPLILYLASGESFCPGAALLLLLVASTFFPSRKLICLRRIAVWPALALMVMASPPFPWIADAIFAAVFFSWLVCANREPDKRRWLRDGASCALIAVLLTLTIVELRYRRPPMFRTDGNGDLAVLGDSISAGFGGSGRPWPEILQQTSGIKVENLSKAGATMIDGLAMADRVLPGDQIVVIELGGNDLIAGEPADIFARALESVLKKVSVPGRTLLMFELPLLPQMVSYGQAQRRLAAKYGVALIPKRCLVSVLSGRDATSDGLHLSDVGARRMAALVAAILSHSATTPATHP